MVLGHNGHAIRADQLARGWFVGSSQVEEVVRWVAGLTFTDHVIILSLADHLAAMGDGLHVILILVAWLIQGILGERQDERLINQACLTVSTGEDQAIEFGAKKSINSS